MRRHGLGRLWPGTHRALLHRPRPRSGAHCRQRHRRHCSPRRARTSHRITQRRMGSRRHRMSRTRTRVFRWRHPDLLPGNDRLSCRFLGHLHRDPGSHTTGETDRRVLATRRTSGLHTAAYAPAADTSLHLRSSHLPLRRRRKLPWRLAAQLRRPHQPISSRLFHRHLLLDSGTHRPRSCHLH